MSRTRVIWCIGALLLCAPPRARAVADASGPPPEAWCEGPKHAIRVGVPFELRMWIAPAPAHACDFPAAGTDAGAVILLRDLGARRDGERAGRAFEAIACAGGAHVLSALPIVLLSDEGAHTVYTRALPLEVVGSVPPGTEAVLRDALQWIPAAAGSRARSVLLWIAGLLCTGLVIGLVRRARSHAHARSGPHAPQPPAAVACAALRHALALDDAGRQVEARELGAAAVRDLAGAHRGGVGRALTVAESLGAIEHAADPALARAVAPLLLASEHARYSGQHAPGSARALLEQALRALVDPEQEDAA